MASDVRKPPTRAVRAQHQQGRRGLCGWCGLAVTETTPVRGWPLFWHGACSEEMAIIERPDRARDAVFRRDQGICCDCGEDWSERNSFQPAYKARIDTGIETSIWEGGDRYIAIYNPIIWISLWNVDHKVPLWKVAHMPDLQRIEYFKLANLITRCVRCHERKTSKEAADRSKFNAQGKPPAEKPKRAWGTRKLEGRSKWPPKGSTPMRKKP